MDCSKNSMMILVICIFAIMTRIGGQSEEVSRRLCDICVRDDLFNCNTTEFIQTNITAKCELYGKVCTLGIDKYFDGIENITLDDINIEDICLLKIELLTKIKSSSMPKLEDKIDGFEQFKATTDEIFLQSTTSLDISEQMTPLTGTESTFGFEDLEAATNETFELPTSAKPNENEDIANSLDYQGDQPTDVIRLSRSDTVFVPTENSIEVTRILETKSIPAHTEKSVEQTNALQSESVHATTEQPIDSARTFQSEHPDVLSVISCFKCDSSSDEACVSNVKSLTPIECPNSPGCVSYYQNGSLIRDCASSQDPELCTKPTNLTCEYCEEATCNDKSHIQCFACNSKYDSNCALWSKVEEIPIFSCPLGGVCLVQITADGDTLRSCVPADYEPSDGKLSFTCNTDMCNGGVFPENLRHATTEQPIDSARTFQSENPDVLSVISCFKCDSSSNEACVSNVKSLTPIECPNSPGCVSYYQNGSLIRDCASSQDPELCTKPTNLTCEYCEEATCNDKSYIQCFACNSKYDSNCALWSKVEEIPQLSCPFGGVCLVQITADGDTLRSCVPADYEPSECKLSFTCNTDMCNGGIFPENRRRCIHCEDCEAAQDPSGALPCALYKADDQCFLYVTGNSKMKRGCVSDVEMKNCESNAPKCITCGDADGCNSAPLMKDAKLSCIKCKTKDEPSCAWAQSPTSVKVCENKVLYYLQETCMVEFDPLTKDTVRDCSFDYGVCAPEDKNCRTCSGNGCNVGNVRDQQCIQCISSKSEEAACAASAEGILPTKCTEELQTYERKGCFSMTKGNVTSRGCTAGLTEDELKLCETQGNTNCEFCVEDGCNNKLAPSSGWRIGQTFPFVLVAVIFLTI